MKYILESGLIWILFIGLVASLPQYDNAADDDDDDDSNNGQAPGFNFAGGNINGPPQSQFGDDIIPVQPIAEASSINAYGSMNPAPANLNNMDTPIAPILPDTLTADALNTDTQKNDAADIKIEADASSISTSSGDSVSSSTSDNAAASESISSGDTASSSTSDNAGASESISSGDSASASASSGDSSSISTGDVNQASASASSDGTSITDTAAGQPAESAPAASATNLDPVQNTIEVSGTSVDVDASTALKRSTDLDELAVDKGEGLSALKRETKKSKAMKLDFGVSASAGRSNKLRRRFPSAFCELDRDNGIICPGIRRGNFIDQFYFDPSTNRCYHYVYNGCGGNANRFSSLWECTQSCVRKASKVSE